jgi:hypothetical protein
VIKSQTLFFEDDTIELMKNDNLSTRQYLIRLTGWNNYYDLRASDNDLKQLALSILNFVEGKNDH